MTDVIQTGFIKTQKRFWRRRQAAWLAGPLMWLAGMVPVCAESPPAPDAVISSEQQAADPAENLPDLGGAPDDAAREKQWAEMAKQLGEKDLEQRFTSADAAAPRIIYWARRPTRCSNRRRNCCRRWAPRGYR